MPSFSADTPDPSDGCVPLRPAHHSPLMGSRALGSFVGMKEGCVTFKMIGTELLEVLQVTVVCEKRSSMVCFILSSRDGG